MELFKKNRWVIIIAILVFSGLFLSQTAFAQLVPPDCRRGGDMLNCDFNDLKTMFIAIVNFLLQSSGVIALLFVLYGGIRMMLSGGNQQVIAEAKQTVFNALLGLLIIASAFILINAILGTLGSSIGNFDNLIEMFNFSTS
jgi:hypothetical protein